MNADVDMNVDVCTNVKKKTKQAQLTTKSA
jgi:hypothetical protein